MVNRRSVILKMFQGDGYPVLTLCAQTVDMGLKPAKSQARFGLPGLPILIIDVGDEELPSDFDVVYAVRLTVSEAEQINVIPPEAWSLMRNGGEMVITPGRHEHAWPRLQEVEVEPNPQEKEGKALLL